MFLYKISHVEGYVNVTFGLEQYFYNYVFNYTDHLGNIRLSYTENIFSGEPTLMEENHYYPFGLKHRAYNTQEYTFTMPIDGSPGYNVPVLNVVTPKTPNPYKYKYNGKEWQDELGLNFYDYGARNYDPALGRWMNIDPLANERNWLSPYNYVQNNPISKVDPDGMLDGDYFNKKGEYLGSDKKDDKAIYITNTNTLGGEITSFNAPKGFYNKDGSVNESVAQGISKSVRELPAEDRIQAAGGIYNHYYKEAGYDVNELKSRKIDNMPPQFDALGLTSVGGITAQYPGLGKGEKAISIEYAALGIKLNNGYDILNVISHERGKHLPDALGGNISLGKAELENRATLHQLNHSSWNKTSPEFKNHIQTNLGRYLSSQNKEKYFGKK